MGSAAELLDPDRFAAGPPSELFDELREGGPAESGHGPTGTRLGSTCSASDIEAVSKDPALWSSWEGGIFPHRDQVNALELNRNLLLFMDPPQHTKYRKILQTAFVPNSVAKLEPMVREIVTAVLDAAEVDASPDGVEGGGLEGDFATDVAVPIPLRVLARLMGLPATDLPQLEDWVARIEDSQRSPEPEAGTPVMIEMSGYLAEQIAAQRKRGDDGSESLVMKLVEAEVDGESLTETEILLFFGLLVFAGNDTTRNTMSSGMLALLEHPDQLELLRAEPKRIPAAVEEILRWTSVVNYFCRTATENTELSGCPIHEGEKVMLWYPAGSRDPAVNDDPQRFDVTREDAKHMAFGGGGRHFCLGAGLARLELRIAFEEILRRWGEIRLAGEPQRVRSNWASAITSLPIQFTSTPHQVHPEERTPA